MLTSFTRFSITAAMQRSELESYDGRSRLLPRTACAGADSASAAGIIDREHGRPLLSDSMTDC